MNRLEQVNIIEGLNSHKTILILTKVVTSTEIMFDIRLMLKLFNSIQPKKT